MTEHHQPSGWFPDPLERYDHRWFNGTTWTSDVSVNGQRFVDPLGTTPGPPPGGSGGTGNRAATAAMVCGIIGAAIAWIPLIVVAGLVLGILAIVFGVRGRRRARTSGTGGGRALTGILTGVLALALSTVGIWLTVDVFREVLAFVEPGPRLVGDLECTVQDGEALVTGTLTNLDDERHDYTVFVTVENATRYAELFDVDPDEVAEWTVRLDGSFRTAGTCEPDVVVNGPFPYGLETDPYRN